MHDFPLVRRTQVGGEVAGGATEHGGQLLGVVRDEPAGDDVTRRWDSDRSFYLILTGRYDVFIDSRLIRTLGPGDHFGELAARDWGGGYGYARLATVRCAEPGRLIRLASADLEPAQSPMEMAELGQVKVLPVVLGVFLALLAIGAVGHALVTVVQRRIQDVAVLRVMGLTPRQCRLIVFTQGSVLALAGLLIGLPAGLVVGRLLWRTVAGYTPVQYVPPIATVVMVVIVPAALVLTSLLGLWPGHRAARLRVANALRAE